MPTFPKAKRSNYLPKRKPFGRRKNPNKQIYNSKRWRDFRTVYIQANPFCEECLKKDIYTDATGKRGVVDHIDPINNGGAVFDKANVQTLCNSCHNKKSAREAHKPLKSI